MPLQLNIKGLFLLSAVVLFAHCTKELSCEDCNANNASTTNRPPLANAGADQTIILPVNSILLNGSNSTDPDNNIASYLWTRIDGPSNVTITDASAVQTNATGLVQGIYKFELKVTDAAGLFSKDTVSIKAGASDTVTRWTKLQSLPENEFFFGSNHINFLVGIQNEIFTVSKIGGFWVYNKQENTWKRKAELPTYMASSNFSVVFSIGNKGFFVGNGTSRQYDLATDQWVTRNNVPVGADHVDYSVSLVTGNKAYMVSSTNNLVTAYDPLTDTYTPRKKFVDTSAAAGFVINGEPYCIQKDGRCWKYNPATDTWQQKASLPPSIYNMSGFTLNGSGYIIGDLNRTAYNGSGRMKLWRYNPSADQWKAIDNDYPGEGVYEIRTVSLDGIVYIGLGYDKRDKDAIDFWSFQ